MAYMDIQLSEESDDGLKCETCQKEITGEAHGRIQELDPLSGLNVGMSYQCLDCIEVLARLALAVGDLEGPDGQINEEDLRL